MAGTKPAVTELVLRRYLPQGRNDRTETHFLGKAMRGPHLLVIERLDERAGRRGKPMDGRAVERNLHDTLADAANQSIIRIAFLTAGELAQRRFDRRPMELLCRREMQRALDACDVDRRSMGRRGTVHHVGRSSGRNNRQQTQSRERNNACA